MHRPGTDEDNVQMADILCDFCESPWTESRPMVEGHRGSCICGDCLSTAYRTLVLAPPAGVSTSSLQAPETSAPGSAEPTEPPLCVLCQERRREPGWPSPIRTGVVACRRCVKQSAAVLAKDAELGWKKPV